MADRNCLVTVVGTDKRVDVAVSAHAAIGEYAGSLAVLCGERDSDVMPAAWSLATAAGGTLPPTASLTEAGIVDGQLLYLRDLTAGEYDEPGVFEVHEVVADAAERAGGPRWDRGSQTAAMLIGGTAWLVAVTIAVLVTGDDAVAGPLAAGAGLLLPLLAWSTRRGRLALPARVRVLLALGGLPCLGVAGWIAGDSRFGGHLGPALVGLAAGVLAGALIALAATPAVATVVAVIGAIVAAAVTTGLVMLHAGPAESAAVAGPIGYLMMVTAPRLASRMAATWAQLTGQDDTELTVRRARRLLTGTNLVSCLALAVALALLGAAADPYAIALACCLAVAAFAYAASCQYAADALPAVMAGLAGLLATVALAPGHLGGPTWIPPAAGASLGVLALATGLLASVRRPAGTGGERAWWQVIGSVCFIAAVPLAVGVFGVFGQLMHMGRNM